MSLEERPRGFAARKYIHSKENFMKNKVLSNQIFTKYITFWEIMEWM